ncbi:MAG: recombinase family protein [Chloroflexota bacterium]|nr:recombinase family protein [Chloroflexota bacterium]
MTNRLGAKRAGLYFRVSTEEQVEGYSLDAQARLTRAYCEGHGWQVVAAYRDEGKSARTDDVRHRPAFAQMLADAERGLLDVVVVHKLDRFARNLRLTLETLERLQRHGVGFVSLSEQIDFTTPIGKVILATLGAFAQYYSDNLATEVKKGKGERRAKGLPNGLLPFGVKVNPDGLPIPDPETYPGLLLAFQDAAAGKSDRQVAEALNAAGYRTTGNRGRNPFTKDTVCRLLQNRFFLGELPDGMGGWLPGAHAPLLDEDLFAAAQRARQANRSGAVKVPRARRRHSLSGLGVCGRCGGRLHILTDRKGEERIYCYQRRQIDTCGQPSLPLAWVEAQVLAYLRTFHLPEETVTRVIALYERSHVQRDDAERRRREIDGRLGRIRELYAWGDLTREAYRAERERLEAERSGLQGHGDLAVVLTRAAAFLRDLPAAWEAATAEERNDLARLVFASVEVVDDRVVAVVPQRDFAPFFLAEGRDDPGPENGNTAGAVKPDGVNLVIDQAEATGIGRALASLDTYHHHHRHRSASSRDRPVRPSTITDCPGA